jgi:hypothetical protein
VLDWKADSEIALKAYVRMPKLKVVMNNDRKKKKDVLMKNTWIADTGASTHMGNSNEGMTSVKVIDLTCNKDWKKALDGHNKGRIKNECGTTGL